METPFALGGWRPRIDVEPDIGALDGKRLDGVHVVVAAAHAGNPDVAASGCPRRQVVTAHVPSVHEDVEEDIVSVLPLVN